MGIREERRGRSWRPRRTSFRRGISRTAEIWTRRTDELDPEKMHEAREEELKELERRVYVKASVQECWERTGKAPHRSSVGGRAEKRWDPPEPLGGERLQAEEPDR